MTQTVKGTDLILESGIKEDATSGREKLMKNIIYNTFVIHHEICKKLTDNRYTFYVRRKHKVEFVRQYDMQCHSESTRNIWDKKYDG